LGRADQTRQSLMNVDILQRARDRIECMRVRPLLQPFLDGELDEARRRRVAAHLEACRRCGLAASTYESLRQRLSEFGQPADPDAIARLTEFVDHLADEPDDGGSDGID
jgi:anti-sigma factor RsiW